MKRIRIGFALLALLLLVPLSILLTRTLQGLDRERDQRHQSVASRVFDEAERSIAGFLDSEEGRPPEHYFPTLPSGLPSPLVNPQADPFVVDYFQIDDAGQIRSPRPERAALLGERLKGLTSKRKKQEEGIVEEQVELEADFGLMKGLSETPARTRLQRPGSTKAVQKLDLLERSQIVDSDAEPGTEPALDAFDDEASESYSSYRVLEQLNLAGRSREKKSAPKVPMREPAASRPQSLARADTRSTQGRSAAAPAESKTTRIDLPPPVRPPRMQGLALDDRHLILYRTVDLAGRGRFQQGLLLDLDRFVDWIEEGVVVESGLSRYITFDLIPAHDLGRVSPSPVRRFIYDHRFSDPFEALGARLTVAPLPDGGGSTNIYLMGFLLITVSTVGLWAMYRRVAVAIHFAERRSNFAAAVSHELKTPLTAIRMYAEMLRDDMVANADKRKEYYGTITAEAERLTRLINNVLEFSNLEKKNRRIDTQLARVEPCLRESVSILEHHAQSRGFTLHLDMAKDLPPVRFEADALQQILFNLIDNALKYAEDASRKQVDITARPWNGGVSIRVRDYGGGVAAEHLAHLLEPFYRGESELTRRTKGTGIGLALVNGLAEEMQAEIQADNAPDGGFAVELRLRG
ncbi:MAG: HAMP domain-containing histidine kinase [bacterium]|nr:HAMP domain-containing histidine kinase [bacterium]